MGSGLEVAINQTLFSDVECGDSISVSGICSTVVAIHDQELVFQYLEESVKRTCLANYTVGTHVNLEDSLRPSSKIGGHFVSGHVDCVGQLIDVKDDGPWHVITLKYPSKYHPYLVEKGSISINGVSLTIVDVSSDNFTCHIIPHTFENTIMGTQSFPVDVHLEFDVLGKYLHHFYTLSQKEPQANDIIKNTGLGKDDSSINV